MYSLVHDGQRETDWFEQPSTNILNALSILNGSFDLR